MYQLAQSVSEPRRAAQPGIFSPRLPKELSPPPPILSSSPKISEQVDIDLDCATSDEEDYDPDFPPAPNSAALLIPCSYLEPEPGNGGSLYATLNLTPTCTTAEIACAYSMRLTEWKTGQLPLQFVGNRAAASNELQFINLAYQVLSNPNNRKHYDDLRARNHLRLDRIIRIQTKMSERTTRAYALIDSSREMGTKQLFDMRRVFRKKIEELRFNIKMLEGDLGPGGTLDMDRFGELERMREEMEDSVEERQMITDAITLLHMRSKAVGGANLRCGVGVRAGSRRG